MHDIITLQDLVAHVIDVFDMESDQSNLRRATRSSVWGFEQASQRHMWRSYDTEVVATFEAPHTDGTVDVSDAGVVTLTGGTWPTWAELGVIALSDDSYRVKSRDSDTELTLEAWSGVAQSDLDYQLAQNRYRIPHNVRQIFDVWDQTNDRRLLGADPQVFRERDRWQLGTSGTPSLFTERRVTVGGKVLTELRITPFPSKRTTLHVSFMRIPDSPKVLHATGSIDVASGTVTLQDALPPTLDPVGSWLRISTTENDTSADLNATLLPPADAEWEGQVTAHNKGAGTLTIDDADLEVTNRGGVLTDILDIPPFLFKASMLYAEAQMARQGSGENRRYGELMGEADSELRYAMEQDSQIAPPRQGFYLRGEVVEPMPYIEGGAN